MNEMLTADGFDDAIIGHTYDIATSGNRMIYDFHKCVEILMKDMTEEEAIDHMEYNVTGAYVGNNTPIFLHSNDFE